MPPRNVLTTPTNLASKNTTLEFNIDKANQLLDQAGYTRGSDGIRVTPSGVRMHVVYQTTINSLRQKEQDIVKAGWQQIGIETELKSVDAGVFFSADPGNPDTNSHFYTDVEMFTSTFGSPFPLNYMKLFYSGNPETDVAQQSNKWAARNYMRWINAEFNNLLDQVKAETDPQKAQQMWMQLNDLAVNNYITIPLIDRNNTDGKVKAIQGPSLTPFDDWSWNIAGRTRSSESRQLRPWTHPRKLVRSAANWARYCSPGADACRPTVLLNEPPGATVRTASAGSRSPEAETIQLLAPQTLVSSSPCLNTAPPKHAPRYSRPAAPSAPEKAPAACPHPPCSSPAQRARRSPAVAGSSTRRARC